MISRLSIAFGIIHLSLERTIMEVRVSGAPHLHTSWRCACVILFVAARFASAQSDIYPPEKYVCTIDGIEREYFIWRPDEYDSDRRHWLIVTVHGGGGNGRTHFLAQGVRRAGDGRGFDAIVISPNFSNVDTNASRFPSLGEGAFLTAVLEELRKSFPVREKIFLTGYSRGAQFSHRFAYQHPDTVAAVAPFASGTWTTPNGHLLIETYGEIEVPKNFRGDEKKAERIPARRANLFDPRVAEAAVVRPRPGANSIPFLVMCGSLDSRFSIAQQYTETLRLKGYQVEADWPRTPHGSKSDVRYKEAFEKYSTRAVAFFMRVANELEQSERPSIR